MTDDIVTRLRALADEMDFGWRPPLLREAAEALEQAQARHTTLIGVAAGYADERDLLRQRYNQWAKKCAEQEEREIEVCADLMRERDALKAKLAMLRDIAQDLCDFNAKYLDEMRSKETWAVEGTLEESPFVTRFRHALSQPGPGAAYQERLRETESKFATQSHNLNVMNERLKKLEAVAERASKLAKMINRDVPSVERSIGLGNALEYTREALAALEEKP